MDVHHEGPRRRLLQSGALIATIGALLLAMDTVRDPRAVPGLTRVIAEERRSSSIELVMAAIGALGGIIGISLFKNKTSPPAPGVIDVPKDQIQTETTDNHQS